MKVWIVLQHIGYDEVHIMGVFKQSSKAHQYMKKQKKKNEYFTDYNIERWEVQ